MEKHTYEFLMEILDKEIESAKHADGTIKDYDYYNRATDAKGHLVKQYAKESVAIFNGILSDLYMAADGVGQEVIELQALEGCTWQVNFGGHSMILPNTQLVFDAIYDLTQRILRD